MPQHKVGILDHATFSNISEMQRSFVMDTVRPWLVRVEQALNAALLSPGSPYFVEHVFEGLLRGNQQERFEAYAIGRQWGFMSQNEIRRRENMPPIDGGDSFLEPLNMSANS
ncbi:MAG TPA: phage portal protein [Gammaproteobacteria bacterium]|nr:phage portal protein [Gammaproteobacteria bacterium]HJP38699.1 phage portal protein [Gammaproteobacteria bacterium]